MLINTSPNQRELFSLFRAERDRADRADHAESLIALVPTPTARETSSNDRASKPYDHHRHLLFPLKMISSETHKKYETVPSVAIVVQADCGHAN